MEQTPVDRVAQLEEQVSHLTSLVEGLQAERTAASPVVSGNGTSAPRSRRDLLKLAGAAAAGAAGVALAGRSVKDAYAVTTDTNFIANGAAALGFDSTPGHFATGVYGLGSNLGVLGQGSNAGGFFLSGARGNLILPPSGSAGPQAGNHFTGDLVLDKNGVIFVCSSGTGATAGTNVPLQQGGINNAIFTTVSTKQYLLGGSDGATWMDMDPTLLSLTIVSPNNARAILFANADLWTDTPYLNQDLAITVNGTVHSWKESGGPGTFSPNAAFVHAVFGDFFAGTTYTVKLQWKANKAAANANQHIVAGAGPVPAGSATFSPTRLSVQLINI